MRQIQSSKVKDFNSIYLFTYFFYSQQNLVYLLIKKYLKCFTIKNKKMNNAFVVYSFIEKFLLSFHLHLSKSCENVGIYQTRIFVKFHLKVQYCVYKFS